MAEKNDNQTSGSFKEDCVPSLPICVTDHLTLDMDSVGDKKQTGQSSFSTTISTGVTRIYVNHSVLQKALKEDYHQPEPEIKNTTLADKGQNSEHILSVTDNENTPFSSIAFDCVSSNFFNFDTSSENEEQQAHMVFEIDTLDEDSNSEQYADDQTGTDGTSSSVNVLSATRLKTTIQTNPGCSESVAKSERYPTAKEHVKGYKPPSPFKTITLDGHLYDQDPDWLGCTSTTLGDATSHHQAYMEETSGSEWHFSGQTFSKAMWRNVSAETSQLNPSFSTKVPLHKASSGHDYSFGFDSSSEDEHTQRQKNISFFNRFRWASKGLKTKHPQRKSLNEMSRSTSTQSNQEVDKEQMYAQPYLDATLAFADSMSKKSKSASLRHKQFKDKTSRKQKHFRSPKTRASEGNQSYSATLSSKRALHKSSPKTIRETRKTELKQSPTTDNTLPFKVVTTEKKSHSRNTENVTSALVESVSSSSELTSSDSHRSVCLTSEGKQGSERSSSSADSKNTIYFVPGQVLNKNSSNVDQVAKKLKTVPKRERTLQECSSDLVQSYFGQKNSDLEECCTDDKHYERTSTHTARSKSGNERKTTISSPDHLEGSDTNTTFQSQSTAVNFEHLEQFSVDMMKSQQTVGIRAYEDCRTSSSTSSSVSVSMYHEDTDAGHRTPHSGSSSNDVFTSGSEIGPLVTFPKSWKSTAGASNDVDPEDAESEQDNMSATELRRRFSAEEYVPASPFAMHRRRHPSNLSDGATPLFLQTYRTRARSSHVRQVSLDIGEEWENVHSPTLSQTPPFPTLPKSPTSPTSLHTEHATHVFGAGTSTGSRTLSLEEWIPLEDRTSGAKIKLSTVRKKSHQTSAKLRLLYPNPADPRSVTMSEEEQRELLSTLTRTEMSHLQQTDSPLLKMLSPPGKDTTLHTKQTRIKQMRPSSPPVLAAAMNPTQAKFLKADSKSQKPIVTVQPMPRPPQDNTSFSGASDTSGDVAIAEHSTNIEQYYDVEALPAFKRRFLPNPFNQLNQRCHGTLQCPCCFFFCFLCCLPAIFSMGRSDYEFDYGSVTKARQYGRRTFVLYVTGAVVALCVWVTGIVLTVVFLQEYLFRQDGWS